MAAYSGGEAAPVRARQATRTGTGGWRAGGASRARSTEGGGTGREAPHSRSHRTHARTYARTRPEAGSNPSPSLHATAAGYDAQLARRVGGVTYEDRLVGARARAQRRKRRPEGRRRAAHRARRRRSAETCATPRACVVDWRIWRNGYSDKYIQLPEKRQ